MFQDMKHGFRSLMRTPSFSVAALLTLALGIGSTAAIFSIAYAVLLKPLPYPDADRLFVLASPETSSAADLRVSQTSEIFHYLRDRIQSLENVATHGGGATGLNLASAAKGEHVTGMSVSRGYFDVIGVGCGGAHAPAWGARRVHSYAARVTRRSLGRAEVRVNSSD